MISVDAFGAAAAEWLAHNASDAPADYGAICPPDRVEEALAWHRRIHAAGYVGIHWPEPLGGHGLTVEHNARWQLEAARAGVPAAFNMVGLVLTAGALLAFGSPDQQARHLDATGRGDRLWCQLFSEPEAGSDLASLTTRAVRDGDHFIVDGQKVWCSGGRYSQWGILLARTDPEASPHRGISFFVVPMDLPGIEVRPLRQMTGGAEFDEVFFTDVRLPADHLLGPLHGGWGVAMSVLTAERGHIGTAAISLERRLDAMTSMSHGQPLGAVARDRLAALVTTGHAYRALAQRQGAGATTAGSLLKLGITEMSFATAMLQGDLAGSDAFVAGPAMSGMLSAPGGRIAGGTSQVQRNIIGERLLGLPREPKPPHTTDRRTPEGTS